MARPVFIAVDWGSSVFRAYLIDSNGSVAGKVINDQGIFSKGDQSFEKILFSSCEQWLIKHPGLPVIMSGMIGSRHGWVETPYIGCPADVRSISDQLVRIPDVYRCPLYIVPGVSTIGPAGLPDVMRGEEVQIFGALQTQQLIDARLCLPGTHSKWADIKDSKILNFSTFMTGELYALLSSKGAIGGLINHSEEFHKEAFHDGIEASKKNGGLSHLIFSARSRYLSGDTDIITVASYLSGLLIGAETRSGLALFPDTESLLIVGGPALAECYGLAFAAYDLAFDVLPAEQSGASGLQAIIAAATLLQQDMEEQCRIA